MLIRPFIQGEGLALLALFQASVRGLASRNYTPAQIEAWSPSAPGAGYLRQWEERMRSNRPWVVEVDGQLAAFADVQPSGLIDQFFVSPDFAGQGIGTALMHHLHEQALALGAAVLTAHVSLTAQPFFRRHGFVIEREQEVAVRGSTLRNAVMRKTLLS
jgi:putative acetyltransferase